MEPSWKISRKLPSKHLGLGLTTCQLVEMSQGPTWVQQAIGNDMHLCSSKSMGLNTHVATSHGCFQRLLRKTRKKTQLLTHHATGTRCICSSQRCKDDPSWQATVSNAALLSKLKCGFSCCKWLFGESTPHIPERRSRCNDAIPAHSVAYPMRLLMAVNGSGACVQSCNPTFCRFREMLAAAYDPNSMIDMTLKTQRRIFFSFASIKSLRSTRSKESASTASPRRDNPLK